MHLVLFLSRATPLRRWQEIGILERETAVYRRLRQRLSKISIVSSGNKEEITYENYLGDIEILYNRWRLPVNLYSLLAPFLHRAALRQATIYKTNQLDGAWTAVIAAKLYGKPVIVRAGYLWASNFARQRGDSFKARIIQRLESFTLRQASQAIVTTTAMKKTICEMYHLPDDRVTVIPNYVDTTCFAPVPTARKIHGRVCFVGRLTAVKNLNLLIQAVAPLPGVSLVLIGEGEQKGPLKALAEVSEAKVQFLGRLDNQQLPLEIIRSEVFVLPSKFEGHPKALIEAMACGTAVIGTDVEGINSVIQHAETGWLCQPTVEGLRQAITYLLANPAERDRLGRQARQYVLENFALEKIILKEISVLEQVVAAHEGAVDR